MNCPFYGLWLILFKTLFHEYGADAVFKENVTGPLYYLQNDFIRGKQIFCKNFLLHWHTNFRVIPKAAMIIILLSFVILAVLREN